MSVANHDDVRALYLWMFKDVGYGSVEYGASMSVLHTSDIDSVIVVLHIVHAFYVVDSVV